MPTSAASLLIRSRPPPLLSRGPRCFFNWLVQAGYLQESPFRSLKNVRLPQRIVRPFSANDITQLLACCDPETAVGARDRAILLTLLDTGIRCSELVQLSLDDLDLTPAGCASFTTRATSSAPSPSPRAASRP